MYWSELI